jgi:hypothetical protein
MQLCCLDAHGNGSGNQREEAIPISVWMYQTWIVIFQEFEDCKMLYMYETEFITAVAYTVITEFPSLPNHNGREPGFHRQ